MKYLILVLNFIIPGRAYAARAIMEQTAASNNTVFIDTQNVKVGISTNAPATTLDVAGTFQSGVGATKSTISTTGSLTLANNASITLSGASGNYTSGSSVTASAFFGNMNQTVITVAPAAASAGAKTRVDFVGDGVNDQNAINSAITAAGNSNSALRILPGLYTLSNTIQWPSGNNRMVDAEGAIFQCDGTHECIKILGMSSGDDFRFGKFLTSGSTDCIHVINATQAHISVLGMRGTGHLGTGFHLDATTTGSSVNTFNFKDIHTFNYGIFFDDLTNIDTNMVTLNYGYDCNIVIYEHGNAANEPNSDIWNVNVDASWLNGGVQTSTAIETNGGFNVYNTIWGGGRNLVLDSGANNNLFNITPPFFFAQAGEIVPTDNSGNLTNRITTIGMPFSLPQKGAMAWWDPTTYGVLNSTGLYAASGSIAVGTSTVAGDWNQSGSNKYLIAASSSENTTVGSGLNMAVRQLSTSLNTLSEICFSANSGSSSGNQFPCAGFIEVQHGARTSGQYHSGDMILGTAPGANLAPVGIMWIKANGNVGISTASPSSLLDVHGTFQYGSGGTNSSGTANGSFNLAAGGSLQRNSVNVSSFAATGALSGTFTNTTLGPCISGSTVTLTLTAGSPGLIQVNLHGTVSVNALAGIIGAGVLVDGAFVDGETTTQGLTAPQEPVSTDGTNMSFSELLTGLSAAQHNICLSFFVSSGTGTIDSTNSVMKMQAYTLP